MIDQNEKINEILEHLKLLINEGDNNSVQILELLKKLDNPIVDESLNTFRREFQKNIARRASDQQ